MTPQYPAFKITPPPSLLPFATAARSADWPGRTVLPTQPYQKVGRLAPTIKGSDPIEKTIPVRLSADKTLGIGEATDTAIVRDYKVPNHFTDVIEQVVPETKNQSILTHQ